MIRRCLIPVAMLTVLTAGAAGADVPELDHPMLGQPAPDFRLSTLTGDELGLEDFRGRYLVLHFGASW